MTTMEKARETVKALDGKKALNIKVLKIDSCTIVADYYVLATGTVSTHIKALADETEYKLDMQNVKPIHVEGKTTNWIVLDYGDIIVHVFTENSRDFYDIDNLWENAEEIDISDITEKD